MNMAKWNVCGNAFVLIALSLVWVDSAGATIFGSNRRGVIASIDGSPAMCLPAHAPEKFPLASFSVDESYLDHSGSWGIGLKPGRQPMLLEPGDCVVLGKILDGYYIEEFEPNLKTLELKANHTYVFQLNRAYQYASVYSAVFCTRPNASGGFDYLQYVRLPGGLEIKPSCDARLNGNAPEPVYPLIYP